MAAATSRTPVTRARVCEAAVALADRDGIDAVSMRSVAGRLGVSAMALYKHLDGKDELLRGMLDIVISAYDPPRDDLGWREGVRERVLSARRALVAHPWARGIIETSRTRTPAVLAYMDSLSGMLMAGGLSVELAHHAMHALGHRIWGFSPEAFDDEVTLAMPEDPAEQRALFEHVQQTYPNILAIALATPGPDGAPGGGCDEQSEFEFTLDLLLDGFERLHEAGWAPKR